MRIRATKPEFWRSESIAQLDWDTRLVLKALESYVDDNGVGKDSVVIFCADAFPHDLAKSPEIVAKVSRSLSRLSDVNIIARYKVSGEALVYVRHWKQWQYIDKPKQGRYPRPDGSMNYRDVVDETVRAGQGVTDPVIPEHVPEPPETFAKSARIVPEDRPPIQSGEQGNRGTGDKEPPNPPTLETSADVVPMRQTGAELVRSRFGKLATRSAHAHHIAQAFVASLPNPIPSDVLAEIAVQIDKCLTDQIPPVAIAHGIHDWANSDSWSPTQIPRFVAKATAKSATHGKATRKALDYDTAAEQLIAELGIA